MVSSGTADRSARSHAPSCLASFLGGGWTDDGQKEKGDALEKNVCKLFAEIHLAQTQTVLFNFNVEMFLQTLA